MIEYKYLYDKFTALFHPQLPPTFSALISAAGNFKKQQLQIISTDDHPLGNRIVCNNHQGICIEEGSCADIIANHISDNFYANIALGGQNSKFTKIMFNVIEKSKKEGIFIVEGGQGL